MSDCIFCKIIAGEIPAEKIYEDDRVLAILDITPINPGHTLVIPKEHHRDITDTPPKMLGHMMSVVQKLAPAIVQSTHAAGFNIGINNGSVAGQMIFHTHIHIMPRHEEDGHTHWKGHAYGEGEAQLVAQRIREQL